MLQRFRLALLAFRAFRAGLAFGVGGSVACYVYYRRRRNNDTYAEYIESIEPYHHFDPDAAFTELDAQPGDVGYDRVEEVDVSEGPAGDDAGAGLAKPCSRRVRRKKVVATPYEGGDIKGAYLAELVAEVRMCSYARAYSSANADLVRAHLKRRMVEHGLRSSHIAAHLDRMVLACYYRSNTDVAYDVQLAAAKQRGRIRGANTLDF